MVKVKDDIARLRREYQGEDLDIETVEQNPVDQFHRWFRDSLKSEVFDPNAFTLSTAGKDGQPSGRIILLKKYDNGEFLFYSHYKSQKALQMEENPRASMTFYWPELERQVRIEGTVSRIPENESEAYFKSRPAASKRSALASPQSREISGRDFLIKKVREIEKKYPGEDIPRPGDWGGYRLEPDFFEFWQGKPSRLHDRVVYRKTEQGKWEIKRLAP